jgi:hypothetical protein
MAGFSYGVLAKDYARLWHAMKFLLVGLLPRTRVCAPLPEASLVMIRSPCSLRPLTTACCSSLHVVRNTRMGRLRQPYEPCNGRASPDEPILTAQAVTAPFSVKSLRRPTRRPTSVHAVMQNH